MYASRILLETLALSMTLGTFTAADRKEARRLLTVMRRAAKNGDFGQWFAAHADYHRLITGGAGEAMKLELQTLADRTIRYIRIYQVSDPHSWQTAGDVEHAEILRALIAGDEPGRAHRDGSPPGAYRAAGAGRLRARLRARRRDARGRAHRGRPPRRSPADQRQLTSGSSGAQGQLTSCGLSRGPYLSARPLRPADHTSTCPVHTCRYGERSPDLRTLLIS